MTSHKDDHDQEYEEKPGMQNVIRKQHLRSFFCIGHIDYGDTGNIGHRSKYCKNNETDVFPLHPAFYYGTHDTHDRHYCHE
jgi:hypothetical protein